MMEAAMSFQKNGRSVRRFGKAMKLANWLQSLPGKLTPPPFRLVQISSSFWQSRALYVAARLDIATALGDAAMDAGDLAGRLGAAPDALSRLMRLLAAMGIFEEVAPRSYRNNKLSAFLRADHPKYVRAMILMHNSGTMSRPWFEQLEHGVREGVPPFEIAHGQPFYDYLNSHADFDCLFSEAMDSVEALSGDSFATDFDWSRFGRIIDVGGSRGTKSLAILKRHPHLTALVIDREQVVAEARRHWAEHPTAGSERLHFQAGDLLSALPPAESERDIYLLSAVLHGFDDESSVAALRNLAAGCRESGARIALLEMVLPETGADVASASFDMQMFTCTRGRERTLAEWKALIAESGLVLEEVVGLQSFASILVLRVASSGGENIA